VAAMSKRKVLFYFVCAGISLVSAAPMSPLPRGEQPSNIERVARREIAIFRKAHQFDLELYDLTKYKSHRLTNIDCNGDHHDILLIVYERKIQSEYILEVGFEIKNERIFRVVGVGLTNYERTIMDWQAEKTIMAKCIEK